VALIKRSVFAQPLYSDSDLTLLGYFAASHIAVAAPRERLEMCARSTPKAFIIGKEFRGIGSSGLVCLASPPWTNGDAGKVVGVPGNLKRIAGAVRGQVRDQDQRLSGALLIVVHGEFVHLDFGHLIFSFLHRGVATSIPVFSGSISKRVMPRVSPIRENRPRKIAGLAKREDAWYSRITHPQPLDSWKSSGEAKSHVRRN
jgi:hypothetical protein